MKNRIALAVLSVGLGSTAGAELRSVNSCHVSQVGILSVDNSDFDNSVTVSEVVTTKSMSFFSQQVGCAKDVESDGGDFYVNAHLVMHRNASTEDETTVTDYCFMKVANRIDTSMERIGRCTQMSQENGIHEAFKACNDMPGCEAVGLYQPPQMPPFSACFFRKVTAFKAKKLEFPGKLFIREDDCENLRRFFPYLSYPSNTRPVANVLQSFSEHSGYTGEDCSSMCDALGSTCSGYTIVDGVCTELVTNVDTSAKPSSIQSGNFYRKALSVTDKLSTCESGSTDCGQGTSDSGVGAAVLVPSIAGGCVVLAAVALIVLRKRSNQTSAEESDEENKVQRRESDNPTFVSTEFAH